MSTTRPTIAEAFAKIKGRGIGLIPFLPAGFPDLPTTAAALQTVAAAGASAIEVGFPFSDPIADGPVIQQAFTAALARKLKVAEIFQAVHGVSPQIAVPLIAMVSYSIVFRFGPERFFADARAAGFSAILIPDLPPPEAQKVCGQIRAAGLDTILLIAPTTTPQRRREIVSLCTGFVYYLSLSGVTGARAELPPDLAENVRELKTLTDLPICVGFGISQARHMIDLGKFADGAIVGSAIVKRMIESAESGPEAIARVVGQYCRDLLAPVR